MNEHGLIKKIIPLLKQGKNVLTGPGDDCAAIDLGLDELFLVSTDQLVSGRHYEASRVSPSQIAVKLLKRNISDIAAMGGTPFCAVLTLASASEKEDFYMEFFKALSKEAEKWNISICGGDISSSPHDVFTMTIMGKVGKNKICLRSGASAGDCLYCTGLIGNSYGSEHHLNFTPRLHEARFLAGKYTRTMIDISDGLLADALHLAESSEKSITLDLNKISLRSGATMPDAVSDGEDYELLFAVSPAKADELEKKWPFKDVELTRIGVFTESGKGGIFDAEGNNLTENRKTGFDHFDDKGN
ncbi:MAG: hypothetical protein A2017_00820 [Lentisphaerae bacterium GWF2_44_16]|nr:MAG: hypothetical protein A2017_00820 [Lentisphaerae bacterium GWF2_44_16]